jgi:hypothetical protein
MKRLLPPLALSCAVTLTGAARADAPAPAPADKPAPYSLPWQLRPAAAVSVVRSDTAFALSQDPKGHAVRTVASTLLASYRVTPSFAPMVRAAIVGTGDATAFVNPVVGATYAWKLGRDVRLSAFLGLTIPVGMGGGNAGDKATYAAAKAGILARSAMDNAMFAVNYLTVFPGVDVAWVAHGATIQAEATLLELVRTRGETVDKDASRTNLTLALHAGYFLLPELSIGAELRHQRWLTTPAAVAADRTGASRDTTTVAIGPRGHFKLGATTWLRPGVSYARGADRPMVGAGYHVVQLDVPIQF